MATKFVYLQGKCRWAKYKSLNKYGTWSVDFFPNEEARKVLNELKETEPGILNAWKPSDDGEFMSFNRQPQRLIQGKLVGQAPPLVVDKSGVPLDGDTQVGNDSDITLKLEVYTYRNGKGRAARWVSMQVDNLVPYTPVKDRDEDAVKAFRGLDEVKPQPLF